MTPTPPLDQSNVMIGGGFIILVLFLLIFWIWMFFSCLVRPGESFPKGKFKFLWLLLTLFIPLGFLLYFFGVYLPGLKNDYPAQRVIKACSGINITALFSIVAGIIIIVLDIYSHTQIIQDINIGIALIVWGCIFFVLGHFTIRNSLIALLIAMSLHSLNGILTIYNILQMTIYDPLSFLYIIPVLIWSPLYIMALLWMWGGISAIREIKSAKLKENSHPKNNRKQHLPENSK